MKINIVPPVTQEQVIALQGGLPSPPKVLKYILDTLNNDDFNIQDLEHCLKQDPVLIGKIFSSAGKAVFGVRPSRELNNFHTALSFVGMTKLKNIVITSSLEYFLEETSGKKQLEFYRHSIATGICAQQLAEFVTEVDCIPSVAMIAGTMHDIGKLWLHHFLPDTYRKISQEAAMTGQPNYVLEKRYIGVDHAVIGAWLAQNWFLPKDICNAIRGHHTPDDLLHEPLVSIVHVAEVLSNALSLDNSERSHVNFLSAGACRTLGLIWNEDAHELFGKIEASTRMMLHESYLRN